jgi:hypothetical protein
MTQKLINMTPHPINILDNFKYNLFTIPASGNQIRLTVSIVNTGVKVNDVTITSTKFGEPIGLPDYQVDVFYIVSQLVKTALPNRTDLLVPAEVQRDEKGAIIGCLSLGL